MHWLIRTFIIVTLAFVTYQIATYALNEAWINGCGHGFFIILDSLIGLNDDEAFISGIIDDMIEICRDITKGD